MSAARESHNLQERYESLQNLCKQLIMVNETLKNELDKLSTVYRKAVDERSMLLSELVEHHSSCSGALKPENMSSNSHQKRPPHLSDDTIMPKKGRTDSTQISEVKPVSPSNRHIDPMDSQHNTAGHATNQKTKQDTAGDFSPPTSESPLHNRNISSNVALPRASNSGQDPLPLRFTTESSPIPSSNVSSMENRISPSAATVSATHYRTPKLQSLVTSSTVSSSGVTLSYVQTSATKPPLTGFQNLKSFPVVSRTPNLVQTSNVSRSIPSTGVIINSTSPVLLNSQTNLRAAKPVQSSQNTTTLRLAGSSSGQRILIQAASGNAKPLFIHPSDNSLGGLSGNIQ